MKCPRCHSTSVEVTTLGSIEKAGTYAFAGLFVLASKIAAKSIGIRTKLPKWDAFKNGTDEFGVPRQCRCKNCGNKFHVRYETKNEENIEVPKKYRPTYQKDSCFEFSILEKYQLGNWVVLNGKILSGNIKRHDEIIIKKTNGKQITTIIDRISYMELVPNEHSTSITKEKFYYIDHAGIDDIFSNSCFLYLKNIKIKKIDITDKIVKSSI